MNVDEVALTVPEGYQVIIGQSHFIKTVEDIFETISSAVPGVKFGVAFCEASGKALIRFDGTSDDTRDLAVRFARRIAAGHSFVVTLRDSFPINVLNRIKAVEEVVSIFCATANDVTVLVAESGGNRGVIGIVDGIPPKGVESESDKEERRAFLRKIGYKR